MVDDSKVGLTDEEKELYDRQIRLWGLEAQKRLRTARVIVIGLNGLGAEITKNIILAGIDKVTLMDSHNVTDEDLSSQFLACTDSIGKNRAEASVQRAQALNPLVKVQAVKESWEENGIPEGTDIVIATCLGHEAACRLGEKCRAVGARLLFCDVVGMFGFLVGDLGEHEYALEIEILKVKPKSETSGKREKSDRVTEMVKRKANYTTIKEALNPDWSSENNCSLLKSLDPGYFVMAGLLKFRDEHMRDPNPAEEDKDFDLLKDLCIKLAEKANYSTTKIQDEIIRMCLSGPTNPVCAILGGVVGQETIRVLSQVDPPLHNIFIFDAARNSGKVITLPAK